MSKKTIYYTIYSLFLLLIVLPLLYTVVSAFSEDSFLENIKSFDKKLFFLLGKSIILAVIVSFFATIKGVILAFLLNKTKVRYTNFFKIVLLIPLFIPPYILAVAWKDIVQVVFSSPNEIISYIAVIIVLSIIFTPLSVLIISSSLYNIDSKLEESGLLLTDKRTVILKIILPLIKPAIISSFVLIFIFSISEFSVPSIFGINVFTTEIFTQFSAFYNHSLAIFQSLLLIILSVSLLFAERTYLSEAPFISIGNQGMKKPIKYNFHSKLPLLILYICFFISIILPFIILIVQAFKNGISDFVKAFQLLTPTFINSIGLAVLGALITVIIGFVVAVKSFPKEESQKNNSFSFILLLIFAIPSSIFGISLIKFYNQPGLDLIYTSYAIIIIGYVGKYSFITAKLINNSIKQLPNSFDETAQIIGISYWKRISKILIPLIRPTIFAAFIISFIFNLIELGTTIMVYPPGTEIMPIKVFTIMANSTQSLYSSMTLIVFLFTILIISIFYYIFNTLNKNAQG